MRPTFCTRRIPGGQRRSGHSGCVAEAPKTSGGFTFSDVDKSGRVAALQAQLRLQAEQFEGDRRRRLSRLGLTKGGAALDVGCGLGEVVAMLADLVGETGTIVGIDASESMVAQAATATGDLPQVEVRRGDALALDFPDAVFDGVHSERVFMHLERPDLALAEVARVTRPGGRIMVVEPEHSMTRIDAEDADTAAVVFWSMATTKMKNPRAGIRLIGQFRHAGLVDVQVEGTVAVLHEPLGDADQFVNSLAEAGTVAIASGAATRQRVDAFLDDLRDRLADGSYLMLMPMFTVSATKPLV